MTDKRTALADIASNSLDCIEKVAAKAEDDLSSYKKNHDITSLASGNTLNEPGPFNNIKDIIDTNEKAIAALIKEPIIARVHCIDKETNEDFTIFITRGTAPKIPGFRIASYLSRLGRIAALPVGEDDTFYFLSKDCDLLVDSSTKLKPQQSDEQWDSKDSEIDIQGFGKFTVGSLRDLLRHQDHVGDGGDDLEAIWDDDNSTNIFEGTRRQILKQMSLRDQPILDKYQDEIFRMPINSRCFLSGPPGTGKTTTLIRRIGQKTNIQALEESKEELQLVTQVQNETKVPHKESWILFTPTELLKQYVKEAFNKEGLAASDKHIRVWEEFRDIIARDELGLLRTSARKGPFVKRPDQSYLKPEVVDDTKWYEEFRNFLDSSVAEELRSDAAFLAKSDAADLSVISGLLEDTLETQSDDFYAHIVRSVDEFAPKIHEAIASRDDAINRILTRVRNTRVHEDRNFPDLLREEVSKQLSANAQDAYEENEFDAEDALDDEDEQNTEPEVGQTVTRRQALVRFNRAIKSLAKSRFLKQSLSEKSQDGILVAWLGPERMPADEDIAKLGKLVVELSRLRKFGRLERLLLRGIPAKYKRFRTKMAKAERWYKATSMKALDIHWQELDLIVLATLRIANKLLANYRSRAGASIPATGSLATICSLQRAQILVDEATDFSRIQLACMNELAHPGTGSLFLCGDINQRITSWGLKSSESIKWIGPNIEQKIITVSYRQSRRLVDLARQIAIVGDSHDQDIVLPDRAEIEGFRPIWQTNLRNKTEIANWLTDRIQEIDRLVQRSTTIAVLVNEEEDVEPLALELNARLEEISLKAVACKDGKVVGNDGDVRVFDIRHIKGLEFEAAFFVDADKTVLRYPDLFPKYLYVGATRAATYLGVTFQRDVPTELKSLSSHFGQDWSKA